MKHIDGDAEELNKLRQDYQDIYDRLCKLEEVHEIDYIYLHNLVSLMLKLIDVVARDAHNVKREVSDMGGGRVLELESDRILQKGIERGIKQGIGQGIEQSVLSLLEDYGVVSDELKEKICSEKDIEKLKLWLKVAARVSSIEEFMERM